MFKEEAMRFGITDLAEMLGITTSAIRYFEKEGLIETGKEQSGRRFYTREDVFRLLSYTKYRSMDIPMKQIVTQFSGQENDWKKIKAREEDARERALYKAKFYQELADSIDDHIRSIGLIETLFRRYEFEKSPAAILMQDKGCGWLSHDRNSQKIVCQWVKRMPAVQLAVVRGEGAPDFGYVISSEGGEKDKLPMELDVTVLESTLCVHTIVKAPEDFAFFPKKIFDAPCQYAVSRGFRVVEPVWGKILLVEVEDGQRLHTYVELWIPVS